MLAIERFLTGDCRKTLETFREFKRNFPSGKFKNTPLNCVNGFEFLELQLIKLGTNQNVLKNFLTI